jgi:S1-C subfamily serine protease
MLPLKNIIKNKRISFSFLFICFGFIINAQNFAEKKFFDKSGKSTFETSAYYYRVPMNGEGDYKSFYITGGALAFEGRIKTANNDDELKNIYAEGTCNWYHKNSKLKTKRSFNAEGNEEGLSIYYYESGKLWKEISYKNGAIKDNRYKEFDEDGTSNRIFEDDFTDNSNDWDVFNSDKSAAVLGKGMLEITSWVKEGTARTISLPIESSYYTLETILNIANLKEGEKAGVIYGFKNWQNYNYFLISSAAFYIGFVYEGIGSITANGMYTGSVLKNGSNSLKILSSGEKVLFSINGELQFSAERGRLYGSNIGVGVSGKTSVGLEKLILKEVDLKSNSSKNNSTDIGVSATGSGIVFSKTGYILTNHHVIDNANKIVVEFNVGGVAKNYNAVVIEKDKENDLAILKIDDASFIKFETLRYSFKDNGNLDVGSSVFTIGYPLALSGMGKEAKFTDGKISAKTGYNNSINSFQTSIPVQPGSSGGPVFSDKGQLIGLINASVEQTDNVSYAIKLNYIKNIIELLPESISLPSDVSLLNLSIEEKIKALTVYVALIKIK